jgi:hypothetical protein
MCEIQRLMGCLLFVDRAADDTPYADLLSPLRWEEVAHEFARQACSLMGQVGGGVGVDRQGKARGSKSKHGDVPAWISCVLTCSACVERKGNARECNGQHRERRGPETCSS